MIFSGVTQSTYWRSLAALYGGAGMWLLRARVWLFEDLSLMID